MQSKQKSEITDQVLVKVQQLEESGNLQLPEGYSAPNAIKSAYLILSEKLDKDKRPVLEVCSKASIANALLTMIVEGLNPIKNQCYFIAYGGKLMYQRGYMGAILLAKRHSNVVSVKAQAIYDGDVFKHQIDAQTGRKTILEHSQELENLDPGKIKGAYCLLTLEDGIIDVEIMNILQIKKSWAMRQGADMIKSHTDFGDEMAKRTVINRACKPYINSSSDEELPDVKKQKTLQTKQNAISTGSNTESIDFQEETPVLEEAKETIVIETVAPKNIAESVKQEPAKTTNVENAEQDAPF